MLNKNSLYDWQKEIIEYEGDCTIRGGRQTGKSWAVAHRILHLADKYPGCRIFIGASAERQEDYLIEKIELILGESYKYRRRKLKSWLPLKNGSDIIKYPLGKFGVYVEGLSSVDFLFIEEAGHVPEGVYDALLPMLAEPRKRGRGWLTLLGNTRRCALKGFYYDSFQNKKFKQFHITPEVCPHMSKEFLEEEMERLGEQMYNVIYRGEFDEKAFRYFPEEKVRSAVKFRFYKPEENSSQHYCGIDPARFGKSKAAFVVSHYGKKIKLCYAESLQKSSMTDLRDRAIKINEVFKIRKFFIDDGGIGGGLIDIMEETKGFRGKIRPMNNRAKSKEGYAILKEDLYSNFLKLLEEGDLEIIDNAELVKGLIEVEFDEEGKITGTDMSEAAVRAAWCSKEKSLKLFAA